MHLMCDSTGGVESWLEKSPLFIFKCAMRDFMGLSYWQPLYTFNLKNIYAVRFLVNVLVVLR